jgi:hypothetical protein
MEVVFAFLVIGLLLVVLACGIFFVLAEPLAGIAPYTRQIRLIS